MPKKDLIEAAILSLIGYYGKALESNYVEKPVSWALYQTWKYIDKREKRRATESEGKGSKE